MSTNRPENTSDDGDRDGWGPVPPLFLRLMEGCGGRTCRVDSIPTRHPTTYQVFGDGDDEGPLILSDRRSGVVWVGRGWTCDSGVESRRLSGVKETPVVVRKVSTVMVTEVGMVTEVEKVGIRSYPSSSKP